MTSQCLPGGLASEGTRAAAQNASSVASGIRTIGGPDQKLVEMVNDGVVATSSVLLIGSFFWVGV